MEVYPGADGSSTGNGRWLVAADHLWDVAWTTDVEGTWCETTTLDGVLIGTECGS